MATQKEVKRITTNVLQNMKVNGEKISMITAYDFSFARIFDAADIDVILVGDSASNVMAGNETTLPITLDQMIYHATSVIRGVKRCLVVVDLPFGSYQSNSKEANRCARGETGRRRRSIGEYPPDSCGRRAGNGSSWINSSVHL